MLFSPSRIPVVMVAVVLHYYASSSLSLFVIVVFSGVEAAAAAEAVDDGGMCVGWQQTKHNLDEAKLNWIEPTGQCYRYTTYNEGYNMAQGPLYVTVHNGTAVRGGTRSIQHHLDRIESMCIEGCPAPSSAATTVSSQPFGCNITYYNDTTYDVFNYYYYYYPNIIQMDYGFYNHTFTIYDLEPMNCWCIGYEEQTNPDWNVAQPRWNRLNNPSCYDFTMVRFFPKTYTTEPAVHVQVRQGVVVAVSAAAEEKDNISSSSSIYNRTLNDYLDLIRRHCIQDCPMSGAYQCYIRYAPEGYPRSIQIDHDGLGNNQEAYKLSDFVMCPSTPMPTPASTATRTARPTTITTNDDDEHLTSTGSRSSESPTFSNTALNNGPTFFPPPPPASSSSSSTVLQPTTTVPHREDDDTNLTMSDSSSFSPRHFPMGLLLSGIIFSFWSFFLVFNVE